MNNFQYNLTDDISKYSITQFYNIFCDIFNDKYDEDSITKFLLELNFCNLPSNAFIGSIQALKQEMILINSPQNCLDVCGTGGDKLNTLNVSTAVSFILASAGICVAKHGNKAISSRSGSADIFFELGIKITDDKLFLEKNLREKKLAFLFAPFFHPALKKISPIRQKIKEPTIFNFLGPLLNPAQTKLQLIGTSRFDTMNKIANVVAQDIQNHAYIVNGFDSMDEISICDKSYLLEVKNGEIGELQIIDPTKFNFKLVDHQAIAGDDARHNSQKLIALLNGEKSPYRDIVILNSAYALMLCKLVKKVDDGIDLAQSLIDSGNANEMLLNLR
jgi:anthranilate phosphoribosyltransferase